MDLSPAAASPPAPAEATAGASARRRGPSATVIGAAMVGLEDGILVVNRHAVREPYANTKSQDSVYFGPVRVPRGAVFVMGDDRGVSEDSREFGALPTGALIGRAVVRLWPPGRWAIPH